MDTQGTDAAAQLRRIPGVDRLLEDASFAGLRERVGHRRLVTAIRAELEAWRHAVREADGDLPTPSPVDLATAVASRLAAEARPYYRRVVNATGVVLHTGLGRAPLAPEAVAALAASAGGAQRLELELEDGRRGGRDRGCTERLCDLLGCEAATVVNNNAAATVLILATLARGRGVAISRGELVEIGGSYRIPDVLRESGAHLVEVGTTNRTRIDDFRAAFVEADVRGIEIGLMLKVHTSNYRIVGFTEEAPLEALATLAREHDVPLVHDLGSGCLVGGISNGEEPDARASITRGADLVCFSGDKLLGGPQAGIIAGRADLVARCRRHPLFRALRPGRLVYTALEATLRLYGEGEDSARRHVPVLERLAEDLATLADRAETLRARLDDLPGIEAAVEPCTARAGSGALPAHDVPSVGVRLGVAGLEADKVAARLRRGDPAVVVRIHGGSVLLDLRSLGGDETDLVVQAVRGLIDA